MTVSQGREPLHGRVPELDAIGELLDRLRDGRGGALAIVADAGLGRTALLDEAARRAGPDVRTISASGAARESAVPYAGLHRLLRPLAAEIRRLPDEHRAALAAVCGGRDGPEPFVLYAALCELLALASRDGPLLCRVDDVQWLDEVSLDALAFAARRVQDLPVAVLLADRDDRPGLAGIPLLRLGPLDEDASLRVLRDAIGDAVGGPLADAVVDLADGRPRAIRDLAAALTPGQLSGAAAPPRALPPGSPLRALHRGRYLRLPDGARRLVLLVVAEEWVGAGTLDRAASAAGIGASDVEAARASGLLRYETDAVTVRDRLVRSSLWADATRAERTAAHALLAEVLVHDWQYTGRIWHRAAMSGGTDDVAAAELARAAVASRATGRYADSWRMWRRASALTGDRTLAADRLLSAAADAWASGRPRRARAMLRRLAAFRRDGDRGARADRLRGEIAAAAGDPAAAVALLRDAAERFAADHPLALETLVQAAEAADAAGDVRAHAEIAERAANLPEPDEPWRDARTRLMLDHLAGTAALYAGRYAEAAGRLASATRLGSSVTDPAALTWAARSALTLGDAGLASALAAAAVAAARRAGIVPLESHALTVAARCEALLARPPAPVAAGHDGLRLAQATRLHGHAAEQHATLALAASLDGDDTTATRHLDRLAESAGRRGLVRAAAFGAWAPACLDLAADRPADAAARLRLPGGAGVAHPAVRLACAPHLVEALARGGDRARAADAFEAFHRWSQATGSPVHRALAHRCRALLTDAPADAADHFAEALRLHETAGAVFEQGRTELLYGHRLRRSRRPRAAREHLRIALRIFERYDAGPWTEQARTELRAAGETVVPLPVPAPAEPATVPGTPAGPARPVPDRANGLGDLTPQQAHIARLVAEGATNREIAARLLLSPRTIDHHLRNVFTRLGIRSRVELARMVR
ncbi:helix-turn-helix transcriptional regulator [Actinomadura algeriensis]|uniref:DNA-binding CsgD family transcriptional regulator/tetratricopeptide (TPR) repeat protein n=1 Tax=Actinomadura algeriensis TaxID=1679523 RepID=A0ABR9JL00_9ACTN|nr:LuxR family transcriptional regulator [Actinomadura algeriensis]MBE1531236.1 DNA-binding CsgD family transcriptional regulator/tetratricopeptide (TPR) repeat protein [Actinomadura algeriensis]